MGNAKRLAYIYARSRNRYKDTPVLGKDVGTKVRKLGKQWNEVFAQRQKIIDELRSGKAGAGDRSAGR